MVIYAIYLIIPVILLLFLSALLAITFCPIVENLQARGVPRWIAFGGIATIILLIFASFIFVVVPQLFDQLTTLPKLITSLRDEYISKINNPWLRAQINGLFNHKMFVNEMPENLFKLGSKVVNFFIDVGIVLTFTFYFMLDGKKAYYWSLSFFKDDVRHKIHRTAKEFNEVVVKYIMGQFVVSALVGIYVFVIMTLLNIPLALPLSLLAAALEVLPIFGFLISLFLIVFVTMTVNPAMALVVFMLFLIYHFIDVYLIIPKVYGNKMRMSGLVVVFSLMISLKLGGVLAVLVILPLIASYPTVEKIWLRKYVGRRTVKDHNLLDKIMKNPPQL